MNTTNIYNTPPAAGEIDLINEVRQLLVKAGLEQQASIGFDNNEQIQHAVGKNSEVQRYHLNRFWTIQLMRCAADTSSQRFCLVPNGSIADWLRLFETSVLPFIVSHGLPVAI